MSELYGRIDDSDALYGQIEEVVKVISDAEWGLIGGDIEDQTDLQEALDLKADKTDLDTTNRKLEILSKLAQGQIWDYDEVDETVYQQTVPAGGHGVEMESVGGRSVVWNQLLDFSHAKSATTQGITVVCENGRYTASGTAAEGSFNNMIDSPYYPLAKAGHKYFFRCKASDYGEGPKTFFRIYDTSFLPTNSMEGGSGVIFLATEERTINPYLYVAPGITLSGLTYTPYLIDLTLLFGSGNEPTTTSDPRIAWIEAYADEHPEYNAGEVIHGAVEEIEEEGKNLLPPFVTAEYTMNGVTVSVEGNHVSISGTASGRPFNHNFPLSSAIEKTDGLYIHLRNNVANANVTIGFVGNIPTLSSANRIFKIASPVDFLDYINVYVANGANANVECDLSFEASSAATTYSPYHHTTYPIPAEVQALDGYGWGINAVSNTVGFRTQKYTQKIKVADMGTLNWSRETTYGRFRAQLPEAKDGAMITPLLVDRYIVKSNGEPFDESWDKVIYINNGYLYVHDSSYTDATAFKAAMSGVMLYYELATSIETDISAYIDDSWQAIPTEPNGSITFTNDNLLPVPVKDQFYVSLAEAI